eukprot:9123653-Pyramimonas_sp.AAC.1
MLSSVLLSSSRFTPPLQGCGGCTSTPLAVALGAAASLAATHVGAAAAAGDVADTSAYGTVSSSTGVDTGATATSGA